MQISMLLVLRSQLLFFLFGTAAGVYYQLFAAIRHTLGAWEREPDLRLREITFPLIGTLSLYPRGGRWKQIYASVVTLFFDLLFFLTVAGAFAVQVYAVGGIFRLSYVVFAAAGFALFHGTLGRRISLLFSYLLLLLRAACRYLFHFLRIPILLALSFIKHVFFTFFRYIHRRIAHCQNQQRHRRLIAVYLRERIAWEEELLLVLREKGKKRSSV